MKNRVYNSSQGAAAASNPSAHVAPITRATKVDTTPPNLSYRAQMIYKSLLEDGIHMPRVVTEEWLIAEAERIAAKINPTGAQTAQRPQPSQIVNNSGPTPTRSTPTGSYTQVNGVRRPYNGPVVPVQPTPMDRGRVSQNIG